MLAGYLSKFDLYVDFSLAEIEHFFLTTEGVVYSYVIQDPDSGHITDFCSFYTLTSSILRHPKHTKLKAAYSYYNVPGRYTLTEIFKDMLILAKRIGCDVFNALDAMENKTMFKNLRFGVGDGNLHYYLYNWQCDSMSSKKIGLILV
jgi:glycylpeptide N-tetradecanoyltransferase